MLPALAESALADEELPASADDDLIPPFEPESITASVATLPFEVAPVLALGADETDASASAVEADESALYALTSEAFEELDDALEALVADEA